MKKIMLVVAVMTFTPVHAQTITVMGSRSCGQWAAVSGDPTVERAVIKNWLTGFMSGLAMGQGKDILEQTDADSIYLWMDNYCRENPLNSLSNGGNTLYHELEARLE